MTFLGPNWKTTVSGVGAAIFSLLTILAALPYDLGDVATIIPPAWKGKLVTAGIIASLALRVWNSVAQKSANVTGGNVQQTLEGNYAKPGTQTLVDTTLKSSPVSEQLAAQNLPSK